ncbi:MAG: YdcF family protein [Clostridia bacterium]|nr:YdcF family protein [Clostridia bacterium]
MKRLLKCLKWLLILAVIAGLFVLGVNAWMIHSTAGAIFTLDEADQLSGDCILVLGCGVRSDGKPSHMLQDRLDVAISAYRMGLAPKLLMSGDHGREHYDEVNAMKDYAISKGVPSEDIFMDHAGFSTYESMYRARDVFQCERLIIVTQNYHLYRAIHNARAFGLEASGISSDLRSYARQPYFDLREAAARVKDWLWCLAKFPPTYLGEAIPIFGDGDETNDR